ncbi:helix-turn-helix domain-containing protein [Catellatospora sp. NPDC049133]|jgi:DNA-binding transcriptional ArsR family regulator|uniref:ArsR/SmtB family transcription factor n=1 Tax=Catellatospora sp. NPDC049133 TaxID=3155499 RepID=UPI0033F71365
METTADRREVQDAETLKALADPARLKVIRFVMGDVERSWTARELAEVADMAPKKIYYHLTLLEQAGLLAVRSTRVVNGIIEKHYGAAQKVITFRQGGESTADEQGERLVTTLFDHVSAEIINGVRSGTVVIDRDAPNDRRALITHSVVRMDPDRAGEFRDALLRLTNEFRAAAAPDAPAFELLIAVHPSSGTEPVFPA